MNGEVNMSSNARMAGFLLLGGEGVRFSWARFISSPKTLFWLQGRIRGSLVDIDMLALLPSSVLT